MTTSRVIQDRFQLVDRLGEGGMGTIWLAKDLRLRRAVALKELISTRDAADMRARRERAMREATALAALKHPAIVSIHDVILEDGNPWIVMEYINGRSLEKILAERRRLDERRLAACLLPVLHALSAAHRAGVVHRDVKPGNILVEEDGSVTLVDFGIAQVGGTSSMTGENMIMGTADYLAPERIRRQKAGPAADLWSVGITMFCAREGYLPFHRETEHGEPPGSATMRAIMDEPPPWPAPGGVLGEQILRLLRKDPRQRPSATEVAGILEKMLDGAVPSRTAVSEAASSDERATVQAVRPRPEAERPPERPVTEDRAAVRGAGADVGAAMLLVMSSQRVAEILMGCPVEEGGNLLQGVAAARPGMAGEILEILGASTRARFTKYLNPETAASILAAMEPGDAAVEVLAPLIRGDADLAAAAIMNLPAHTAVALVRKVVPADLASRLVDHVWESYVDAMAEVDADLIARLRKLTGLPVKAGGGAGRGGQPAAELSRFENLDPGPQGEVLTAGAVNGLDGKGRADPAVRFHGAGPGGRFRGGGGQAVDRGLGETDDGGSAMQLVKELGLVRLPVGGQAERAGDGELVGQLGQGEDLVDPVGARARAALPGHQVPAPRLEDQAVRFEPAVDVGGCLPAPVADLEGAAPPDGIGDRGEERHLVRGGVPAGGIQVEAGLDAADLLGQRRRQGGADLELSGREYRAEAQLGGGAGEAGQGEGLGLIRVQAGEPGPVAVQQLVAAAVTGVAVQRDAGRVQRFDVTVDRADRDLQLLGELARGHPAARLQQQQDGDQTARAHAFHCPALH